MPMHMTRALAAALRAEAEAAARPCLDMNAPLADSTGLPDPRYFLDHAHLTVEGHARTAVYLAERLSALGLVPALPHGWREAFEKALRAHNARFDERAERAAASEMRMSSGTFFLLFGNFREALPELTGAFESGATGVIEQDADLALKLMFCAYALAGQQDAWERLPEGRRRHHAGELYAEMLAARDRGELGSFVREIAAGRRGVPAER
ncbi:MAG: hypothetical protein ACE5F1_08135, partial [Planctomycetota bacterium]